MISEIKNSILIFILVLIKGIDECANPETNESQQSLRHSTEGCYICCCLDIYQGDGGICTAETTFLNIYKCTETAILSTYQTVLDHLPPTNCFPHHCKTIYVCCNGVISMLNIHKRLPEWDHTNSSSEHARTKTY